MSVHRVALAVFDECEQHFAQRVQIWLTSLRVLFEQLKQIYTLWFREFRVVQKLFFEIVQIVAGAVFRRVPFGNIFVKEGA